MTDVRLSRGGRERMATAAAERSTTPRGPNPTTVATTDSGAVIRYKLEDIGSYKGVEFYATDCSFEVGRDGEEIQYPYVDGQCSEDTGRLPQRGTITTRWFGPDWLSLCENFLGVIEARSEPGDLQLPGGFAVINAKVWKGSVRKVGGRGGCEVTLTWSEESFSSHVYMFNAASSPAMQAEDLAAGTTAEGAVSDYAESIRNPDATLEDQMAALNEAEDALDADEAGLDLDTPEDQEAFDRNTRCRQSMYEAYPDQDLLSVTERG